MIGSIKILPQRRTGHPINGEPLANTLEDHRVPLVFLAIGDSAPASGRGQHRPQCFAGAPGVVRRAPDLGVAQGPFQQRDQAAPHRRAMQHRDRAVDGDQRGHLFPQRGCLCRRQGPNPNKRLAQRVIGAAIDRAMTGRLLRIEPPFQPVRGKRGQRHPAGDIAQIPVDAGNQTGPAQKGQRGGLRVTDGHRRHLPPQAGRHPVTRRRQTPSGVWHRLGGGLPCLPDHLVPLLFRTDRSQQIGDEGIADAFRMHPGRPPALPPPQVRHGPEQFRGKLALQQGDPGPHRGRNRHVPDQGGQRDRPDRVFIDLFALKRLMDPSGPLRQHGVGAGVHLARMEEQGLQRQRDQQRVAGGAPDQGVDRSVIAFPADHRTRTAGRLALQMVTVRLVPPALLQSDPQTAGQRPHLGRPHALVEAEILIDAPNRRLEASVRTDQIKFDRRGLLGHDQPDRMAEPGFVFLQGGDDLGRIAVPRIVEQQQGRPPRPPTAQLFGHAGIECPPFLVGDQPTAGSRHQPPRIPQIAPGPGISNRAGSDGVPPPVPATAFGRRGLAGLRRGHHAVPPVPQALDHRAELFAPPSPPDGTGASGGPARHHFTAGAGTGQFGGHSGLAGPGRSGQQRRAEPDHTGTGMERPAPAAANLFVQEPDQFGPDPIAGGAGRTLGARGRRGPVDWQTGQIVLGLRGPERIVGSTPRNRA